MERIRAGSESEAEKEGRGLNTDAYCPRTLAAVSRTTTSGQGKKKV